MKIILEPPYKEASIEIEKIVLKLKELEKILGVSRRGYIAFPYIFKKIGGAFCMKKQNIWSLLEKLQYCGYLTIIPFRGIRLHFTIKHGRK